MLKTLVKSKTLMKKSVFILFVLSSLFVMNSCSNKTTSTDELLAPSNISIILIDEGQVQISWQDNSDNEIKFIIDRKKGIENWIENFHEVSANITSLNDFIPTNSDTIYSYTIRAFDGEDYSAYSDTVAWFSENSAPTDLEIEQIAQDSLKLTWQDNSIGEEGFSLDRKIGTDNWINNYKIIEKNEIQFTDYTNTLNEITYYRISAFSGSSNSFSILDSLQVILPSPTHLIATVVDDSKIRLDWDDNSINEEGFKIERKKTLEDFEVIDEVEENITNYIDESVKAGITYYYRIYAYTQNVQSNYSNEVVASITQIELWVPQVYPTIQSAIDAANDGEIVLVHPGTYYENINFNGKNIIVQSSDGADFTTIDGSQNGSVVRFSSNEDSTAVLRNFIIKNGTGDGYYSPAGGGIYCENANPKLVGLIIRNNSAEAGNSYYGGGGIYCRNASPFIGNCSILHNYASDGGGIFLNESNPTITNTIISNNSTWPSTGNGGGISITNNSNPTLENVTISTNSTGKGGGLSIIDSAINISNAFISYNYSSYRGGGIYSENSDSYFNNIIVNNNNSMNAGGIYSSSSESHFTNVIIANNYGGIITFSNNVSIYLLNSIIWNNENYQFSDPNDCIVTYSDIQGGFAGEGNINSDPLFLGNDDFHLQAGSPCIDAGFPSPTYYDPDGSINDIGAYGGPNGVW